MCEFHQPRLLDTFTGRTRLEGRLRTRTALHIGAGGSGDPLATDLPVVRSAAGEPYVPGASLKGVVRSAAEALFRSRGPRPETPTNELWSCDPLAHPCLDHDWLRKQRDDLQKEVDKADGEEKKKTVRSKGERQLANKIWQKSCTVCRLFGSLAMASRVRFPDLPLASAPPPLEIRNGVAIDRDKELARNKALYDFEAVPPGTEFELTVIVDNPVDAEVGLLLYLFEELDAGNLALGGKSSRGLGLVAVEWQDLVETTVEVGGGENPFKDLLRRKSLLEPEKEEEAPEAEAAAPPPLPETGNAGDWQTLAGLLEAMDTIDKSDLARAAVEHDLTKKQLSDRLGLGLENPRKAWDVALERLADCGFLVREGGEYVLASRVEAEAEEAADEPAASPALDKVFQRYISAMSNLWEES